MNLNDKIAEEEAKLTDPKGQEKAPEAKPEPKPEPAAPIPEPKELDESVYAAFEKDIPGSSAGLKRIVDQEKQARDQARQKSEEADRILREAQETARKIEEDARTTAEQKELKRMTDRLVKDGEWTREQADTYLEAKGIATKPTLDDIAKVVVDTTEQIYARLKAEQDAEKEKLAQGEIRSQIAKAFSAIRLVDPSLDNDDVTYLLKKETKKNPNITLQKATDEVIEKLKPKPKEPDKTGDEVPEDEKTIEEEKKSIFRFTRPK